jgi:hypothetical protein
MIPIHGTRLMYAAAGARALSCCEALDEAGNNSPALGTRCAFHQYPIDERTL